jgi:DNA-binding IclR family transcriptional regulator
LLPFPVGLSGARSGHLRVWQVLAGCDRALRTVKVAEAAGLSRSAAANVLASLARVRAVRRSREGGADLWALPPAALETRDQSLAAGDFRRSRAAE